MTAQGLPAAALDRGVEVAFRKTSKLDHTGERAGAIGRAAAAAHDFDLLQSSGIVGGPIDPPAERVDLGNAVQDQQSAARGVAAQRSKSYALAGRMTRRRIRA